MTTNAERLAALFEGLDRAHGQYTIAEDQKGDKVSGKALTHRTPATLDHWEQHLAGEYGLGIIPITDEATCIWGAIDVDVYPLDLEALQAKVLELSLPLFICETKSGGAHLYLFLQEPLQAKFVRETLDRWAEALGFGGSEVFPKQNNLASENDVGNWINMPYFGGSRRMYPDRDLAFFLGMAEMGVRSWEQVVEITAELERGSEAQTELLDGAPPCLIKMCEDGIESGRRNESMYNIAVYAKQKYPDNWGAMLHEFNDKYFTEPLDSQEVDAIHNSLETRETFYQCNTTLSPYCKKTTCKKAKYGVGGDTRGNTVTSEFKNLAKMDSEPCLWFLEVDGNRIELTTDELHSFPLIKKKCAEKLTKHIGSMSAKDWDEVLSSMMNEDEVDIIIVPEDAGTTGQFKWLVNDFLTGGHVGVTKEELTKGRPYYNPEDNRYYFRINDLQKYLVNHNFRSLTTMQMYSRLRDAGADSGQFKIQGACVRWWSVPALFETQTDEFETEYGSSISLS